MRSLKVSEIIHLFAVLHAAVALLCRLAGVNDELVLTLLTIVLIVLICLRRGLNVELTAASVIVVNVIGYLLAALLTGALAGHSAAFARLCAAMAAGCLGCYALGTAWFMAISGTGLWRSLALCVLPYLPGDAVKIALAALAVRRLRRALPRL